MHLNLKFIVICLSAMAMGCSITDSPFDKTEPAGNFFVTGYGYMEPIINSQGIFYLGLVVGHYFEKPSPEINEYPHVEYSNLLLEFDGINWKFHNPENIIDHYPNLIPIRQIGDSHSSGYYISYSRESSKEKFFSNDIYKKIDLDGFIDFASTPAKTLSDSMQNRLKLERANFYGGFGTENNQLEYFSNEGKTLLKIYYETNLFKIKLFLPNQFSPQVIDSSENYLRYLSSFFKLKGSYYATAIYSNLMGDYDGTILYKIEGNGNVKRTKLPFLGFQSNVVIVNDQAWVIGYQQTNITTEKDSILDSTQSGKNNSGYKLLELDNPENLYLLPNTFIGSRANTFGYMLGENGCIYEWEESSMDLNLKISCFSNDSGNFVLADSDSLNLPGELISDKKMNYASVIPKGMGDFKILLFLEAWEPDANGNYESQLVEAEYENGNWELNVLMTKYAKYLF